MAKKQAPQEKADRTAALVDEAGDLKKELDPLELKRKRYESIRKALREQHGDDQAPDKEITLEGKRFTFTLGPRENETEVGAARALTVLGKAKFLKACSITLTALRRVGVSAETIASLSTTERTGSRSISIAEKGRAAQ